MLNMIDPWVGAPLWLWVLVVALVRIAIGFCSLGIEAIREMSKGKILLHSLCLLGVHLRGISGQSCMYNITVCDFCRQDVALVWKDRYHDVE